ncbi:STAS domain-containing protein [Nonomuraea sp. NPDC049649]|uniref:STAS domain-containing protein n=1 Tax=Nonomuraea sp. NPDC049649 TaxID=3155776 RepID=UPI0034343CF7
MHLSVQLTPVSDTTVVVALTGELDASTVPILSATLGPLPASPVLRVAVAAGELWFCDLSGLALLLGARRELRAKGGELVLAEASPALRRLIALLPGGGPSLPVFDTLPEALAAFGARERRRRPLPRLRCTGPGHPAPPRSPRPGPPGTDKPRVRRRPMPPRHA